MSIFKSNKQFLLLLVVFALISLVTATLDILEHERDDLETQEAVADQNCFMCKKLYA